KDGFLVDSVWASDHKVFNLSQAPFLPGIHNHHNILAAYGAVRTLGVSVEDFIRGIQTFKGLPHRMEILGTFGGVTVVNDSKGTNTMATARSLATFDQIHWILGGRPKDDDLSALQA